MSKFINKVVTGVASVALAASMLVMPFATSVAHAATPGQVFKSTDGTVWFITKDMHRRPFTSAGAFLSYGFLSFSQVQDADSSVTALPTGDFIAPQDGRIFCATATKDSDVSGECSLITGGKKAAFTSASVFTGQGYSFSRAFYGDSSFLTKTSNVDNASAQHRPGTLINNGGTVQLVVSGGLWGVPSMDVFNSWGWSFADVVPANSADTLLSQTGIIPARMAGDLVPTATTPVNPGNGEFDPNGGTQGSINQITMGSRDKTEALEGQNDVEIYATDVKTNSDGALQLKSADVYFAETDGGAQSQKPWKYFTDVSLMVGGEVVATHSASSSSDWSSVSNTAIGVAGTGAPIHEYKIRFTGLNAVLSNNATTSVSVAVSMVSTIDTADQSATWNTELGAIRVLDESGFTTDANTDYTTSQTLEGSFTVGGAKLAVLAITDAADQIDAQVIEVSKTVDTTAVPIYAFNIKESNSVDVNVSEMTLTFNTAKVTTNGDSENTVIRRAALYDGSTRVSNWETVPDGGITLFDNLDINVDGDSTKTLTVQVDLFDNNSGARYDEGTTLSVGFTSLTTFTDANGNDEGDITPTGTPSSNTHTLRSQGISVALVGTPTAVVSKGLTTKPDLATYTFTFDVTAFGADMYIDGTKPYLLDATDATGASNLIIVPGAGGTGTQDAVITALDGAIMTGTINADSRFLVSRDSTKRFQITSVVTPTVAGGLYSEKIGSIHYAPTDVTGTLKYTTNLTDFVSPSVNLVLVN